VEFRAKFRFIQPWGWNADAGSGIYDGEGTSGVLARRNTRFINISD
jgi:hypothetical protein